MPGRTQRVVRPARSGLETKVIACLAALLFAGPVARAEDTVMYAQGRAQPLAASSTEAHVELQAGANVSDVSSRLQTGGYHELEAMPGVSERFRIYKVTGRLSEADKATILGIPGVAAVRPAYTLTQFNRPVVLTGQMTMRLVEGANANALAQQNGLTVERHLDWLGPVYVFRANDESQTNVAQIAAGLRNDPSVVYSQPTVTGLWSRHQVEVTDPLFDTQWHLRNLGTSGGILDADIDAAEAWETTMGEGVVVAVLDSSIEVGHEDLAENYSGIGFDAVLNTDDPNPFGSDSHGTSVTGLICAGVNGIGGVGVAPKASFMAVALRFFGLTDIDIAEAFDFVTTRGADVVNNSWGGPFATDLEIDAIRDAAIRGRNGRGMLILFSSGNDGQFIAQTAAEPQIPEVMAVGALLRDGSLTCYSNFGSQQSIAAPGGGASFIADCFKADIVTTDLMGTAGQNTGGSPLAPGFELPLLDPNVEDLDDLNYTSGFNGTSAACPVATGVAALALSLNPDMTRTQLRALLEHTAERPNSFRADFDPVTGHNVRFGHGRVNAANAVAAAKDGLTWPGPPEDLTGSVESNDVRLLWTNPIDEIDFTVLVVRSLGILNWAPTDGENYEPGDQVAPGVFVVENATVSRFAEDIDVRGRADYAVFVRNAQGKYSWGRRKTLFPEAFDPGELRVTITARPTAGRVPLNVEFFGGVGEGITPVSFEWDFDDGTPVSFAPDFVSHTFTNTGVYRVRLTVTDDQGRQGAAQAVVTVELNNLDPLVTISADPLTGFAPLAVSFSAEGSDPDGQIRRFLWDFGDGSEADGARVDHVYEDPGQFLVTLTALDDQGGSSVATIQIVVAPTNSTTGSSVSGAQSGQTAPAVPGFCGAMGVETLALTGLGLLAFAGLISRRRRV